MIWEIFIQFVGTEPKSYPIYYKDVQRFKKNKNKFFDWEINTQIYRINLEHCSLISWRILDKLVADENK